MNKCLGRVRGQAATNETELPQLEETGLTYGRNVVSHTELCVEGRREHQGSTRLIKNLAILWIKNCDIVDSDLGQLQARPSP